MMKRVVARWISRSVGLAVVVLAATAASGVRGGQQTLNWYTVEGGGSTASSGGVFMLSGTAGQPDAGVLTGGSFALTGGFWFPQVPADCNVDGGVDLYDYASFEACMTGPGGGLVDPACLCFDLNGDGDVDLEDVSAFQRSFNS